MAVTDSIWSPREHFALTLFNNELWVMGGWNGTTYYNDVWHSPDGMTWRHATAAAAWDARYGLAGVAQGGRLWIIGGQEAATDTFDVWGSVDGANWVQYSPAVSASRPVQSYGSSPEQQAVGAGGRRFRQTPRLNEVWSSRTASPGRPSLWSARSSHRVLAGLGGMWLIGGEDDDALPQSRMSGRRRTGHVGPE